MPQSVLIAFVVAVLVALVAVAYLWRVQRSRFVVREGIHALAAMRWREFSQFVMTALEAQGFDAHPLSSTGNANEPADLVLTRDGRSWLLSCRQAADYRVSARQVEEMRHAVASRSAAGGIIATLGQVDAGARRHADDVELIDGATLWTLIGPLLPPGLHEHLAERAQARTRRATAAALGGAAILGALLSLAGLGREDAPAIAEAPVQAAPAIAPPATVAGDAAAPSAAPAASAAPAREAAPASGAPASAGGVAPAPTATDTAGTAGLPDADLPPDLPADERQQRQRLVEDVARLPGIERAFWSSRSTLVVQTAAGAGDPRETLCAVVRPFDTLRASRIQVQPPAGSTGQVRFFHCAAY